VSILNDLPIWLVYLVVLGLILLSAEVGFRLGLALRQRGTLKEKDSATGSMVGALLGLLAFFLAFSIGFALTNFSTRRQLVLTEANAIGTAYLRAGFLDEASRDEAQELFREYLDLRFAVLENLDRLQEFVRRGEEIQNELWALAEANAVQQPDSEILGLFIEALNDVIDIQTVRVVTDESLHLPTIFWVLLISITALSFLIVGIASSADGHRNYLALAIFALAFAAAIVLLFDLDNPQRGLLEIGQKAMIGLQQQIGTPVP
jgi:hypothetical protein